MRRTPLLAVMALVAAVALPSAEAAPQGDERVQGDERLLVVLASAGSKPYSVAQMERTLTQVNAFIERSSFGQTHIRADVTPWLPAFTTSPGCGGIGDRTLEGVFGPARAAAHRAGYDTTLYDDVIYAVSDAHCGFHATTVGHNVMLAREPTVELLVHELGHTFGLGHAQAARCVDLFRCGIDDTGDTLSPMGVGSLDFSAYEKSRLGWIPAAQPRVTAPGRFVLAPPTSRTRLAQALVVETARGTWWIEYRSRPFRGLVFRFIDAENHPGSYAPNALLVLRPTKAERPWIVRGESYRIPFSFRVTLTKATTARAEVRFRP